jgi:hypothetical protein
VFDFREPDGALNILELLALIARGIEGRNTIDCIEDLGSSSNCIRKSLRIILASK